MKQINQAGLCKRGCRSPRFPAGWDLEVAARPGLQSWGADVLGQAGPGMSVSPMGVWPGTQAWRGAGRAGLRPQEPLDPDASAQTAQGWSGRDTGILPWGPTRDVCSVGSSAGMIAWGQGLGGAGVPAHPALPSLAAPSLVAQPPAPEPLIHLQVGKETWRGEGVCSGSPGS